MDTSRIVINTIDNSTSLIENPTAVTGFTVVKAEKGPRTPIRFSSGSAASLKDVFGVSSQEYPELYEVETFNKEYDVWVSAPYAEAKVPVAYITNDGIFVGKNTVDYDDRLEAVINGIADPSLDGEVPDALDLVENENTSVLLDVRYQKTNGLATSIANSNYDSSKPISDTNKPYDYEAVDLGKDAYPKYYNAKFTETESKYCMVVNLGLRKDQFILGTKEVGGKDDGDAAVAVATLSLPEKINAILLKGLANDVSGEITVTDSALSQNSQEIGKFGKIIENSDSTFSFVEFSDESIEDEDILYAVIYGADSFENFNGITKDFVKDYLDQEDERKAVIAYMIKDVSNSDIHGMILPKYPSARALHIDFNAFNSLQGWPAESAIARNIVKMSAYEDGAFHDSSHKVSVSGSLNKEAKDANGAPIGFNNLNSSYANQELVFVYTVNPFTSDDKINKSISRYPSIVLDGGMRSLEPSLTSKEESTSKDEAADSITKDVKLHDIGWKLAQDGDYSDVDIFFDSSRHSKATKAQWSKSLFFSLAKTSANNHELAGYIFNSTMSPEEVDVSTDVDQLGFGRNYWNTCNEAIIDLSGNGNRILSPLTGAKALMQCRIIENRYGGVAPMWENQGTPAMGGQLKMVTIYKMRYKYSKSQLDKMDELNYNPIINDRQYGVMCVGQKTCKDGEITDWSYIGHASAFLNFIKQVRENVMIPQIGKANNSYYRTLRKEQVEQYLSKRLEGNNRIWAEASVDTSTADGVNDVHALRARKFVINVRVRVDVFSESVELNFTNEDQATTISA